MPLDDYRRKRDFSRTPEPSGDRPEAGDQPAGAAAESLGTGFPGWDRLPSGRRFCVQRHRATRMHWDLRLEHGGVLLSWAVPQGPSLDPAKRRLAIHVEDHPIDYGEFEGVIPDGYGMGTVELWDAGTLQWIKETSSDVDAALRKGDVKFVLDGQKLRGEFVLVHTGGRDSARADNNWLLIKKRDQHAVAGWEAAATDGSVKTGRSLDEVAAAAGGDPRARRRERRAGAPGARHQKPDASPRARLTSAPLAGLPDRLRPMLAMPMARPFSRPDWVYELKYDGVRALVAVEEDGRVRIRARSGRDETPRYPELAGIAELATSPSLLVDGEIVALDDQGVPSFQRLQSRINISRPSDIERARIQAPATFVAFDLIVCAGRDIREWPLRDRTALLRDVLADGPGALVADHVAGDGEALFAAVRERGLEGIVAKRADSPYRDGRRSQDWVKVKAWQTQDCVVCGFTGGRNSRGELGALLLAVVEEGRLVAAGRVGSGLDNAQLRDLHRRLLGLQVSAPAVDPGDRPDQPVTWVRPELVCEVRHAGWTASGALRHPSFRGLRSDKSPSECVRERLAEPASRLDPSHPSAPGGRPDVSAPSGIGKSRRPRQSRAELGIARDVDPEQIRHALGRLQELGPSGSWEICGRTLRLTNLDKVLWPDADITKRDLIAHNTAMAPLLLPYLRNRPIGMQVFPDGIGGKHFWRKDKPSHAPDWMRDWRWSHDGRSTCCILAEEPATLAWLGNLGVIDIHPWHSRVDAPEQPDWAVFDLDPFEPMGFDDVVLVAKLVRAALDHYSLRSALKTSGQTGLQIYVPLRRGPDYAAVRGFVEEVGRAIGKTLPDKITWEWSVARRTGKLRIDYTQNIINKTLAAPYSARPAPGAPVSTPIRWEELDDPELRPNRWTVRTIGARVVEVGDLFGEVLSADQALPPNVDSV